MRPLLFSFPGCEGLAASFRDAMGAEDGGIQVHRFPDGENKVRLLTAVEGRDVALLSTLAYPESRVLPLLFAADAARDLGAKSVGLVAPYLAYMRQDRRFRDGEAISSATFAKMLSSAFDWMATVDPHLHRYASLSEIYSIPTEAVAASPSIARYIEAKIPKPVVVGPDSESKQWVSAVAERAGAPYFVLEKLRLGDRDVEIKVPGMERWKDRTPVLVDDIVSTARTMIETVAGLLKAGANPPICIGVHAIFADRAYRDLLAAGAARVVTANTIGHESNAIDVGGVLAEAALRLLGRTPV